MRKYLQSMFVIPDKTKAALAKMDESRREQETYDAGQQLFHLVSLAHSRLSRARLCDYAHDLAVEMMKSATLEEIRACCMRLEEEMSL